MTQKEQTFGQRLRAERKRLGLTKAELAEVLGEVSASWVDKAERGVTEPHQWMKDKALEELGRWEEFKSTETVEAPKPFTSAMETYEAPVMVDEKGRFYIDPLTGKRVDVESPQPKDSVKFTPLLDEPSGPGEEQEEGKP